MFARVRVITADTVVETKNLTWAFTFAKGVPPSYSKCEVWGYVSLAPGGSNLWKQQDHDSNTISWHVTLADSKSNALIASSTCREQPPQEEGLKFLLEHVLHDKDTVTLLMERRIYERFSAVCRAINVTCEEYHHPEPLSTS